MLKGSFESLQKSLLGLHGGHGDWEKLSGDARRVLLGADPCLQGRWWLERPGGSSGSCSEGFGAFEGAKEQFRKPTKKACTEASVAAGEALWACKAGAFRCSTSACRGGRPAAVMEAAARGLEPLKVPKGSFESLQKLLGLLGGSSGRCRRSFLGLHGGCLGEARVPEKVVWLERPVGSIGSEVQQGFKLRPMEKKSSARP